LYSGKSTYHTNNQGNSNVLSNQLIILKGQVFCTTARFKIILFPSISPVAVATACSILSLDKVLPYRFYSCQASTFDKHVSRWNYF
jgi:hypothetical protein